MLLAVGIKTLLGSIVLALLLLPIEKKDAIDLGLERDSLIKAGITFPFFFFLPYLLVF
jgi:hypothetical protein